MASQNVSAGSVVGVVKGVNGEVTAVSAGGMVRTLRAGDKVFAGETVRAGPMSSAHIDFVRGGFATVGSGQNLSLDGVILTDAFNAAQSQGASVPSAPASSIGALQSMIEDAIARGEDPTQLLEAAAAGPGNRGGTAAEEGSSFVIIEQNAARGEVTPGFETASPVLALPVLSNNEGHHGLGPAGSIPTIDFPVDPDNPWITVDGSRLAIHLHESGLAGTADSNAGTKAGDPDIPIEGGGQFFVNTNGEGLRSLLIGGVDVMGVDPSDPSTYVWISLPGFPGEFVVIAVIGLGGGYYGVAYEYRLTGNYEHEAGSDSASFDFTIVATDVRGASATAGGSMVVVDDNPAAGGDFADASQGSGVVTGSVLEGWYENDRDGRVDVEGAADSFGADGKAETDALVWDSGSITLDLTDEDGNVVHVDLLRDAATGELTGPDGNSYGILELNADGTYTYAKPADNAFEGEIVVVYTITDGDGDEATGTLTLKVEDAGVAVTLPVAGEAGYVAVNEKHLQDGSDPNAGELTAEGFFTVNAPDGLGSLLIEGTEIWGVSWPVEIAGQYGMLTVTDISGPQADGTYTIIYEYKLERPFTSEDISDNQGRNTEESAESFAVQVADIDGDRADAAINIAIVDDVPVLKLTDTTVPSGQMVDGVLYIAGGADGIASVVINGVDVTQGGTVDLEDQGTLVVSVDAGGSYSYVFSALPNTDGIAKFSVVVTDGDGDVAESDMAVEVTRIIIADPETGKGAGGATVSEGGLEKGTGVGSAQTEWLSLELADGLTPALGLFEGKYGVLEVRAAENGGFEYQYILKRPVTSDPAADDDRNTEVDAESFVIVLTDAYGNTGVATIYVDIEDDIPVASADIADVGAGVSEVSGNILDSDAFGADGRAGEDGLVWDSEGIVVEIDGVRHALTHHADGSLTDAEGNSHGTLVLEDDGSYTYVKPAGYSFEGDIVVGYTIKDADGDTADSALTLRVRDADVTVDMPAAGADGSIAASEKNLASGSEPDADALTQAGSFKVTAEDGLASIEIGGVDIPLDTTGTDVAGEYGTLTVTGIAGPDAAGSYTVAYTYTLERPFASEAADENQGINTEAGADSFTVRVVDSDGDAGSAVISIDIVDDIPVLNLVDNAVSSGQSVAGDLDIAGGADGLASVLVNGVDVTEGGVISLEGQGVLTVSVDASGKYTYVFESEPDADGAVLFNVMATDGDGDVVESSFDVNITRITIADPEIGKGPAGAKVYEGGLPGGSGVGDAQTKWLALELEEGLTPAVGTFEGEYGILEVRVSEGGGFEYQYTLHTHLSSTTGNDGRNVEIDADSFKIGLTDSYGNTGVATIHIDIIDDIPILTLFGNSVLSGHSASGDMDIIGGVDGIVSVAINGVDVTEGGSVVLEDKGELTVSVDAEGNYSYVFKALPDTDGLAVFRVAVTDGDGDIVSSELSITVTQVVIGDPETGKGLGGATVSEGGLEEGSGVGSARTEWLELELADDLTPALGTFEGEYGILEIRVAENGGFEYQYTLTKPVMSDASEQGPNVEVDADSFVIELTDTYGNTGTATISVDIIDDIPVLNLVDNAVSSGRSVAGELDIAGGADGVASVIINGVDVTEGGVVPLEGQGVLTVSVDASGSYSYIFKALPDTGDMAHFDVTVTDGDGDVAASAFSIAVTQTVVSDIEIGKGPGGATVSEGGLADGSGVGSARTGWLDLELADGLTPALGIFEGEYGILEVRASEGGGFKYQYTLTTPLSSDASEQGRNIEVDADSFTVRLTDTDGNTGIAAISIDIADDIPVVNLTDSAVSSGQSVGGDLDIAGGADGIASVVINGVDVTEGGVVPLEGQGVLTVSVDVSGSYSYVFASLPDTGGMVNFDVAVTDGDGDVVSSEFSIAVTRTVIVDPEIGKGPGGATVSEGGLEAGSGAGLARTEWLELELAEGLVPALGTFEGKYGILEIRVSENGGFKYQYTLTRPVTSDAGEQGRNIEVDADSFKVVLTDPNGNTGTATISIDIADDIPVLNLADNSVSSGSEVAGMLDISGGADGIATVTINGVDVTSGGTVSLPGQGVLAVDVDAEGNYSYTFASLPDTGGTAGFDVAVTDGDGDVVKSSFSIAVTQITIVDPEIGKDEGGATVHEGGLADGSGTGSARTEWFALDIADGLTPELGIFTGEYGILEVRVSENGGFQYQYTLTRAFASDASGQGRNVEVDADSFKIDLTDTDGNTGIATIHIDIVDDIPVLNLADNAVSSGKSVSGEMDIAGGADGIMFVAVNGVDVTSGGMVTLPGQGTLTVSVDSDGSYSYVFAALPDTGGVAEFAVVVTDGDGDAVASDFSIAVTRIVIDDPEIGMDSGGAAVFEGGLAGGSGIGSARTEWIRLELADGLKPETDIFVGEYGILEVREAIDGSFEYQYTLTSPVTSEAGGNGRNVEVDADSFAIVLTDAEGNTGTATIHVDIVDDIPLLNLVGNAVSSGRSVDGVLDINGGADGIASVVINGVDVTSGGTVELAGKGTLVVSVDAPGNYSYEFTALPNTGGAAEFEVVVTDGDGDAVGSSLAIAVTQITIVDPEIGKGLGGAAVSEGALAGGSGAGSAQTEWLKLELADGLTTEAGSFAGKYGLLEVRKTIDGSFEYQYTLTSPVTSEEGGNGRNIEIDAESIAIVLADGHGNTGTATIHVDITDDVPALSVEPNDVSFGRNQEVVGVITLQEGADGANWSSFTLNGQPVVFDASDSAVVSTEYGSVMLTRNDDGTILYSFTIPGNAGSGERYELNFRIEDNDGDAAVGSVEFFAINAGVVMGDADGFMVYEKHLEGGTGDSGQPVWSESKSLSFDVADGFRSVSIESTELAAPGTYTIDGRYGQLQVGLALDQDGKSGTITYQYLLTAAAQHAPGEGANTTITDDRGHEIFQVTVTDIYDQTSSAAIDVTIVDDVPVLDMDGTAGFINVAGVDASGKLADVGADVAGARVEFDIDSFSFDASGDGALWSYGGSPIVLSYGQHPDGSENRSVLVGKNAAGTEVFMLTGYVDAATGEARYHYEQNHAMDVTQETSYTVTSGVLAGGGNIAYYSYMPDGTVVRAGAPANDFLLHVSAQDAGGQQITVNGNAKSLGTQGGKILAGEAVVVTLRQPDLNSNEPEFITKTSVQLTESEASPGAAAEVIAYCHAMDGSGTAVQVTGADFTGDQVLVEAPEGFYISHIRIVGIDGQAGFVGVTPHVVTGMTDVPLSDAAVDFVVIDGDGDAVGGTLQLQPEHSLSVANDGFSGIAQSDHFVEGNLFASDQSFDAASQGSFGGGGNAIIYGPGGDDIIFGGEMRFLIDGVEHTSHDAHSAADMLKLLQEKAGGTTTADIMAWIRDNPDALTAVDAAPDGSSYLSGSAGNDIIVDGSGDSLLFGSGESDIFVYTQESLADKVRGDTILGFTMGQDVLDISDVLQGYAGDGSDLISGGFLSFENIRTNADGTTSFTLCIDQDGSGGSAYSRMSLVEMTVAGLNLGSNQADHAAEILNQMLANNELKF